MTAPLPAAARAFDAVAPVFDARFGEWLSVAAQRRAVRDALAAAFAEDADVLELGGGTGEDARWLSERRRRVCMTDASPAMVDAASRKLRPYRSARTVVVAAEHLEAWARDRAARGEPPFDGAFSNFAALNCVLDLRPVARGLAQLIRPGGAVLLVLFGTCSPGEVVVQCARGSVGTALRRLSRGNVTARLGGRPFEIRYHRLRDVVAAMQPAFELIGRRGIGVFVPPSAAEGRRYGDAQLLSLPYLSAGPLARQWRVRARTFDAFRRHVLEPAQARRGGPLDILDLGAGNGWLSYRLALGGHRATAIDVRDDAVDGLGAARAYVDRCGAARLRRVAASFEALPLRERAFDVVVFNASLHYATDLPRVLGEAARVCRGGGRVAILDSPFYRTEEDGLMMVREKHRTAGRQFGDRADDLLGLPFVEFLTERRLEEASREASLRWRRRRVRYPLWYELRPFVARLRRARPPSRFDLWETPVP